MYEYEPIIKKINPDIVENCVDYLKTHNMANRGRFDGDPVKQKTGLVGELECYFLLKWNYPNLNEKEDGFDGGIDIVHEGYSYDVKTMGRKSDTIGKWWYANNFVASQLPYKCDRVIFASINWKTKMIEFCGWLHKKEIPFVGKLHKKGEIRRNNIKDIPLEADSYEIMNRDLRDIRELL